MPNVPTMELLSPAGSWEKMEYSVRYGADAVYLGTDSLTMRGATENFTEETLPQAVRYCHERGVKVYLTANTFPRNDEAARLEETLDSAAAAGVDAIIAADLCVLMEARRRIPQMDIHISTQAGVVNYRTAEELFRLGAKRVILARELTLEEIRELRQKTSPGLEIEVFVHGAMCISFSGRCVLSNYLAGRDSNRGQCAQPCRWSWRLVEEKRPNEFYPVFENGQGSYILNAKDLCMLEYLQQLQQAGVSSLKIEGRSKSAYYAAAITNAYRAGLRALQQGEPLPDWALEETRRVSHRQYCTGFYFGRPDNGQNYGRGGYVRDWEVSAIVQDYADGWLRCEERNRFHLGDTLEIIEPGRPPETLPVTALRGGDGQPITQANHPMMTVLLPAARPYMPGSILRRAREEH